MRNDANDPTETLPIDYCALRGPDPYAILYEDRRAPCLARAEEDDSIVRLIHALDDAALEGCSRMRRPQGSVSSKCAVRFWRIFFNHQLGGAQRWPRAGH